MKVRAWSVAGGAVILGASWLAQLLLAAEVAATAEDLDQSMARGEVVAKVTSAGLLAAEAGQSAQPWAGD